MDQKKIVRSVFIQVNGDVLNFEFGKNDVVGIFEMANGVKVYFRGEDEKIGTTTPRKMEDRPMTYYHGYPFVMQDKFQ